MIAQRLAWCLLVILWGGSSVQAAPVPDKKPSDKVRKLQQERLKTLEEVYESQWERVKIGREPMAALLGLLQELTEARLELADTEADAVKALTTSLELHRVVEDQTDKMVEAGLASKASAGLVRTARLKVEIQLEKRKAR